MVLVKGFSINGAERINSNKGQTPLKYFDDLQFERVTDQELIKFANEINSETESESAYDEQLNEIDVETENDRAYDEQLNDFGYDKQVNDFDWSDTAPINDKTEIFPDDIMNEYENEHELFINGNAQQSDINEATEYQILNGNHLVWL